MSWWPWTRVSARMRSRISAAASKSSAAGRGLHLGGEPLLDRVAAAGEKRARLLDQRSVILPADAARRKARCIA